MTYEDDVATETELHARVQAAALELFRTARQLHWGSGEPIADSLMWIEEAAAAEGYSKPPSPNRRRNKRLPFRAVWDRDGWTCQRCGGHTDLTVDHIVPLSRGGSNSLDNLQTLCRTCNCAKGAKIDSTVPARPASEL